MNYNQFLEKFKPIKNHLDKDADYNGYLFETFGYEEDFVKSQPEFNIWTMLQVDGFMYMSPGFHRVNRFGYFMCEIPWEPFQEAEEDICLSDDDEKMDEFIETFLLEIKNHNLNLTAAIEILTNHNNLLNNATKNLPGSTTP